MNRYSVENEFPIESRNICRESAYFVCLLKVRIWSESVGTYTFINDLFIWKSYSACFKQKYLFWWLLMNTHYNYCIADVIFIYKICAAGYLSFRAIELLIWGSHEYFMFQQTLSILCMCTYGKWSRHNLVKTRKW